jgi:hypothetical protein
MLQITLRIPDELASDLKAAAREREMSVNRYATAVLAAATDPGLAAGEQEELIARLSRAGLLEPAPTRTQPEAETDQLDRARKRAGTGRPLSEIVSADRD